MSLGNAQINSDTDETKRGEKLMVSRWERERQTERETERETERVSET